MPRRRLTPSERRASLERRRIRRRAYMREYYCQHREERMASSRNWQERHSDAYKEYQREYRKNRRKDNENV